MSRRQQRVAIGIAICALLGVGWLISDAGDPATPAIAPAEDGPEPQPSFDPVPREPFEAPAARLAPPVLPELRGLAAKAADDYRERARFPPWSRPLPGGQDPIREARAVDPGHSLPRDLEPGLILRPAATGFVTPEPVVIHATLHNAGRAISPRALRGEIRDPQGTFVAALVFADDGKAADARAGDLDFTASVSPGATAQTSMRGAYLVSVTATTEEGELRSATTGFLYSAPKASLTGRYRDAIVEGNLVVDVEIEVAEASRFHLEATLANAAGAPFAWSQYAQSLEPGVHWLPLTVYGLVMREGRHDGPYLLRSLSLTTVDGLPNQKSPLATDAHRTRAYESLDFHGDPFEDPALLRSAESLEDR
ncbi:MAG: hypothetical protein GY937_13220 [bacterium]|nr:hypothetical protein [bacterium]